MFIKWVLLLGLTAILAGCGTVQIPVESVVPAGDMTDVSTNSYIVVVLTEDLPQGSGPGLLETEPFVPGRLWVEANKVIFEPSRPWVPWVTYTVNYSHPSVGKVSWSFTTGDGGAERQYTSEAPGYAAMGPFGQVIGVTWALDSLAAVVRDQATEAVLVVGPHGNQEIVFETDLNTFYLVEPLASGLGVVYSNLDSGKVWHWKSGALREVSDGLIFKISPDRQRAVAYNESGGYANLLDFQEETSLALLQVPAYELPYTGQDSSWSPDSRHFVYRSTGYDGSGFIEILDAQDGSVVRTISLPGARCIFPEWSPQGDALAFLVVDQNNEAEDQGHWDLPAGHRLGIAFLDGRISYFRPESGGVLGSPVWSPDGRKIAFAVGENVFEDYGYFSESDIYVMDVGGAARKVEGIPTTGYTRPLSFSPDGENLLVSVFLAQGVHIRDTAFLVTPHTDRAVRVGEIGGAHWVDKDRMVVWFLDKQMGKDLWLIDAWGGFLEPLSEDGWYSQGMAISRDSSKVAFIAYSPGSEFGEYVILRSLDGSD